MFYVLQLMYIFTADSTAVVVYQLSKDNIHTVTFALTGH